MGTAKPPPPTPPQKLHCNGCGQKTKHKVIAKRDQDGEDRSSGIYWSTVYEMFECLGCEDITMRRRFYFSEYGPGEYETEYYPPRIARRLPKWIDQLDEQFEPLLKEVYGALQANSRRLAMMGARTLIDLVMDMRVGDVGNFYEKLQQLEADGFLARKQREVLEAALDVGNAASHRGHNPKREHVGHVMDIVENLLQATVFDGVVEDLKNATPPRKKVKKKKPEN